MLALTLHPLTAVAIVVVIAAAFLLLMAWALFFCGAKDDKQADIKQVDDLQAHMERRERDTVASLTEELRRIVDGYYTVPVPEQLEGLRVLSERAKRLSSSGFLAQNLRRMIATQVVLVTNKRD